MTHHPEDAMTRERVLDKLTLALEQAQDCIRGEQPEDMSDEEAREDTLQKIREALFDIIPALASAQQEPAPAAAENAWIEHIRSNNYDYEYEKIRSAFIAGFAAARASGEKGGADV